MKWEIKQISKPKLKNSILIEGLPGIGNIGKIVVDFMIDNLNAKKLFEISSYSFPHCVFINEDNLVDLPLIEIYYKNFKDKSILFLSGDVQPQNERSCYEFCDTVLDLFQKDKGKEIITLGGIGFPKIPRFTRVYCTGNNKKAINKYKYVKKDIYGVVGPIMGVSGLLVGLAGKRKIIATSLLAETFAHPNYLGIEEAKKILNILNQKLNLKLNVERLDEEFEDIKKEIKVKNINKKEPKVKTDISYIG